MTKEKKITTTIEITHKNILFGFLLVLSCIAIYFFKDLVIGLFISILLATALNPLVSKLEKLKIPRPFAIVLIYAIIFLVLGLLISAIVPPLVEQTNNLVNSLPIEPLREFEVNLENFELITNQIDSVLPIIRIVTSTFSGLITAFTFAVITFYLLIERKDLHKHLLKLIPEAKSEQKAENLVNKVEQQIGSWGQR